jgi:hypothetical protein
MDEIGISLVGGSFCSWPQEVLIHKSVVVICRICTHIQVKIVLVKTYITILHDMRASISRIVICCPRFDL